MAPQASAVRHALARHSDFDDPPQPKDVLGVALAVLRARA
jgi:hypothetical protein